MITPQGDPPGELDINAKVAYYEVEGAYTETPPLF